LPQLKEKQEQDEEVGGYLKKALENFVQYKTIEGEGRTAAEAIKVAMEKVPSSAFNVSDAKIIEEGKDGTVEVQAYSDDEAYQVLNRAVPYRPHPENAEGILAPIKGFLGLGKRKEHEKQAGKFHSSQGFPLNLWFTKN